MIAFEVVGIVVDNKVEGNLASSTFLFHLVNDIVKWQGAV